MKKYTYLFISLLFLPVLAAFIYSCTGVTIEDCNCDDFGKFDTLRIVKVDTIYQVDTSFKGVEGPRRYWVQIGCFMNKSNAEKFVNQAESKLNLSITMVKTKENLFKVLLGEYEIVDNARDVLSFVKSKGYTDAFIRDQYGAIEK